MEERLQKILSRAGVSSRRKAEELITQGAVSVNDRVVRELGTKADFEQDRIRVNGQLINKPSERLYFMLNKPKGYITSTEDPEGRPTVTKLLGRIGKSVYPVGRLDFASEGLLLLTNDGQLARALEMPSTQIVRRYRARAHGRTTQEKLDTLLKGVTVEGVRYGPVEARLDKAKEGPQGANLWITVTLHEGKNREVRRVLESIGLKVNRLIRLAYGPLALGTLGVGEIEEVGPRVVREQFAEHIDPDNLPTGERPQYRVKPKTSRRDPTPGGAEALARPTEPKVKPAYKAGWAKPKIKARAHPPPKKKAGAKSEGPTAFGPRPGGPKDARPRPPGAKDAPPKRGGPKGPGPARPSGSPRAGGPSPGPRGPRPGPSPRGTPGARPPGRPRPGGRGPRG